MASPFLDSPDNPGRGWQACFVSCLPKINLACDPNTVLACKLSGGVDTVHVHICESMQSYTEFGGTSNSVKPKAASFWPKESKLLFRVTNKKKNTESQ